MTMLEVKDVMKSFRSGAGTVMAVNGVTMTVADGEFVAIVGRSGSGKTTLMNLLGALEQPTSGMIFVDGQDITQLSAAELVHYRGRKIGFVFQSYNLVPNLTSAENVMLPMEFIGVAKAERDDSNRKRHPERIPQCRTDGLGHHHPRPGDRPLLRHADREPLGRQQGRDDAQLDRQHRDHRRARLLDRHAAR
jgi:predicted ABC-type transport system involved in lysophospholipase L1 biosynthesis ATPase subunit